MSSATEMFLQIIFVLAIFQANGAFGYVENLIYPASTALIKLGNYDSSVRPPGLEKKDDPLDVTVGLYLRNVEFLDHKNNRFKVQIILRELWTDPRLAFSVSNKSAEWYPEEITTNDVDHFWKPDLFFGNELEAQRHTITKPNVYARISSSGRVLLSSRYTLTLECRLKGAFFPWTSNTCKIHMASYGYTVKDVQLKWRENDAIESPEDLRIEGYSLVFTGTQTCSSKASTGVYGCLEAVLLFDRDVSVFIGRVFLPLFFLVVASWGVFWLPVSATLPRLTFSSIITLIITYFCVYQKHVYRVPAFCFLDIWMSLSSLFVYSAFFQYFFIIYRDSSACGQTIVPIDPESAKKESKLWFLKISSDAHRIDAVSRIIFPATYLLMNIIAMFCILSLYILHDWAAL